MRYLTLILATVLTACATVESPQVFRVRQGDADITVRYYDDTMQSLNCQTIPSGTCVVQLGPSSYFVEIDTERFWNQPAFVREALRHELEHVRLWQKGVPGRKHHEVMRRQGRCFSGCADVKAPRIGYEF